MYVIGSLYMYTDITLLNCESNKLETPLSRLKLCTVTKLEAPLNKSQPSMVTAFLKL